ncbi:uncharacterized protein [Nothobranchius furzeri]
MAPACGRLIKPRQSSGQSGTGRNRAAPGLPTMLGCSTQQMTLMRRGGSSLLLRSRQSEAEAIERPQRRRVKPIRYVQDRASSEDEAQTPGRGLPPPPAIPPVRRRFILPNNGPLVEVPPVPQLDLTNYQHVMTLGTSLRQAIDLQGHQGTQGVPVPTPSSSGGMMREESAVQVPTVCPNSSPGQWQQKDNTTSLLHEVLVKQEIILQQQRGLTKMVQDLFVAVAALQGLTTGGSVETRHHSIFPLADVQALMALERELGISATLAHELSSTLSLAGGSTVKDTVWRVLKGAMTNALAKGITWRGQNGKVAFERLHLKGIVIAAVRRNPVCVASTEAEIVNTIKKWFYWAGDRDGGRKRRMPTQPTPQPAQDSVQD